MADLRIKVDNIELEADWVDENPITRTNIDSALPVEGQATRWGDELYFDVPVDVPEENGRTEMPIGGIAYWPPGSALCLFWGPTPASEENEPRASSNVNLVAIMEDTDQLSTIDGDAHVQITSTD